MKRFINVVLSGLVVAAMTTAVLATIALCFSVLVLVGAIKLGIFVTELQKVDAPPVFMPLEATAKAGMILVKTVAKFAIREGSPVVIRFIKNIRSVVIKLIARAVVGGRQLRYFDFDSLVGLAVFAAGV